MKIPNHIVGYSLTSDECCINLPNGTNLHWTRIHPVRQPDGEYQREGEWCGQFKSRMVSIIKEHGFPILHEQGMRPMVASTKEEPKPHPMYDDMRSLKKRRARLLDRLQEACEAADRTDSPRRWAECYDLQDELTAVESALGFPEPKEPRESTQDHCPTCLCLLEHEGANATNPMQSCQCDILPKDHPCHELVKWSKGESGVLCPTCNLHH